MIAFHIDMKMIWKINHKILLQILIRIQADLISKPHK